MLGDYRFWPRRAPPLTMLCRAGVDHAWRKLKKEEKAGLLAELSPRAKASVKRHLQTTLQRITRPSFDLEWTSFTLALSSLGFPGGENAAITIQMFLRDRPDYRLGRLFKRFPALAQLWALAIGQWHDHIVEILRRTRKDRNALSRTFFKQTVASHIMNLRLGLSDPHHCGRSVSLIEFSRDDRVIYKPRSGRNELGWFSFLEWMNRNGFQPKLRLLRVLARKDYCWMEYAKASPCANVAAVRRFYERLGGLIAAAYLLKAVDCHRENLIAAGEHPVLVDVDALWHVSPQTKTQSVGEVLYRTGFFPNERRHSLQSRSSVLGPGARGTHLPRLGGKPVPRRYANEIISGFTRAWHCLLSDPRRRATFNRMLRQVRARERRWIYCATARYAAILRASVQPAALLSTARREAFLQQLCARTGVTKTVVRAEMKALRELNIPYFNRRTGEWMPMEPNHPPAEPIQAIRQALEWPEN
ncbi:MAG: type 2 lanthipeptide synthetase LanM [Chthoniobacterales bacterium]